MMDEIFGEFYEGPEAIQNFDQYHAHAIELLRNAQSFYLVTTDETGHTTYTCAIENGEREGESNPRDVMRYLVGHVIRHATELINHARAELDKE